MKKVYYNKQIKLNKSTFYALFLLFSLMFYILAVVLFALVFTVTESIIYFILVLIINAIVYFYLLISAHSKYFDLNSSFKSNVIVSIISGTLCVILSSISYVLIDSTCVQGNFECASVFLWALLTSSSIYPIFGLVVLIILFKSRS